MFKVNDIVRSKRSGGVYRVLTTPKFSDGTYTIINMDFPGEYRMIPFRTIRESYELLKPGS